RAPVAPRFRPYFIRTSGNEPLNRGVILSPLVARAEPVIVFDSEPGVIVRTYWYPPWRNRHYFPRTGKRPKIGRREILPKHRMSKPEEYFRFWSASSFPDSGQECDAAGIRFR